MYIALHSILKIRFGVLPLVEVKIPRAPGVTVQLSPVHRSSQNGAIRLFIVAVGNGQTLVNAVLLLVNCKLPFELRLAPVNGVP